MEKVRLFVLMGCPYCKQAFRYIEELQKEERYQKIVIDIIDEQEHADFARQHNYYYVPTFYYRETKLHEGAVNFAQVKQIFDQVLADA